MTKKIKKISIRTKEGWVKVENKNHTHCDKCNSKLWIGPGNQVYCNKESHD